MIIIVLVPNTSAANNETQGTQRWPAKMNLTLFFRKLDLWQFLFKKKTYIFLKYINIHKSHERVSLVTCCRDSSGKVCFDHLISVGIGTSSESRT